MILLELNLLLNLTKSGIVFVAFPQAPFSVTNVPGLASAGIIQLSNCAMVTKVSKQGTSSLKKFMVCNREGFQIKTGFKSRASYIMARVQLSLTTSIFT